MCVFSSGNKVSDFTVHLTDFSAEVEEIYCPMIKSNWTNCLWDKFGKEYLNELLNTKSFDMSI